MADTKITALAAIATVDPAADVLPIVDISDTSMAATGTTKKVTSNQILGAGGTATLASATITGALTVDTTTLVVDSTNDRVGIGTATPNYILDISGATPRLHIKDNGTGSSLVDIENNAGTLYVGRENSTGSGGLSGVPYAGIMYLQGAYPLIFGTNFIERARLNSTGAFVLAGGTTTANGIGVAFPTTQSASSDANCLDDYEEGTFTPTVTSVGGTGIVYVAGGSDAGKYTKIGNLVSFTVNLNGTYTGTFSYIRITLPFTVGSAYDAVSGYNNSTGLALAGRTDPASARFIVLYPQSSGDLAIYTGSYNV